MYRQMKIASDELIQMKKLLEAEKQKANHAQMMMNKTIDQISSERDNLKMEVNALKE